MGGFYAELSVKGSLLERFIFVRLLYSIARMLREYLSVFRGRRRLFDHRKLYFPIISGPRFLVDIDIFFTSIVLHLPDTVAAGDNPFRRPVVLPLPRGRIDDSMQAFP